MSRNIVQAYSTIINHGGDKIIETRAILKSIQRNVNNRRHALCQHTEFLRNNLSSPRVFVRRVLNFGFARCRISINLASQFLSWIDKKTTRASSFRMQQRIRYIIRCDFFFDKKYFLHPHVSLELVSLFVYRQRVTKFDLVS